MKDKISLTKSSPLTKFGRFTWEMIRKTYLIAGLLILVVFFHLHGIQWGIPSKDRIDLVFRDKNTLKALTPAMLKTHEEIRDMQVYHWLEYAPDYDPKQKLPIKLDDREIMVSKEILNASRTYLLRSYGSDEEAALVTLSQIRPSKLDFDLNFFIYGGAYLYPLGIFLKLATYLKGIPLRSDISYYFFEPENLGYLYIYARAFGASVSILSTLIFYFICLKLFKKKFFSLFLSFCFGAMPAFVIWSHYLKPYSYGILWIVIAIWFVVNFYQTEQIKCLYLASFFSGLALGTLLHYGYVYWFVLLNLLFVNKPWQFKIKTCILSFFIFLGAYILSNPYVLTDWDGLVAQVANTLEYWPLGVHNTLDLFKFYIFTSFRFGMGSAVWLFIFLGIFGCLIFKPEKRDWLFFLTILPGFLYMGLSTGKWVHYSLFLYPFLLLFSGFFFDKLSIFGFFFNKTRIKIIYCLLGLVVIYTFLYVFSYVRLFKGENIRTEAGHWINQNIDKGSKIGLMDPPAPWRTPPFYFIGYNFAITSDREIIEKEKPEYFIVSEFQWLRTMGYEQMEDMLKNYAIYKKFERPHSILDIRFNDTKLIPHDWCEPNPTILIWKRKN
jgi:hypothetical protein